MKKIASRGLFINKLAVYNNLIFLNIFAIRLIFVFLFPVIFNICRELLNLPCPEFLTPTPFVLLNFLHLVPIWLFHPFIRGFCLFSLVSFSSFRRSACKTYGDLYGVAPRTHHTHVPIPVQICQYYCLHHMLTIYLAFHAINSYPVDFILSTSRESRELTSLGIPTQPYSTLLVLLFKICIHS